MKCLERNKQTFHYALYVNKTDRVDEYGNVTGEYDIHYAVPVEMKANISSVKGESQIQQFGNSLQYDKVIVIDDMSCPIDENSVLFVDTEPSVDDNGNLLFDYIVKKVAPSLNSIAIAISKVAVS